MATIKRMYPYLLAAAALAVMMMLCWLSEANAAETTASGVASDTVQTAHIADDAVDKDKLAADVAGSGMEQHTDGTLRIAAAAGGDGIQGGAGSALAVDVSDFAGTGLEDDGSENLRIAAVAAGAGLAGGAGSALSLDINSCAAAAVDLTADSLAILDATDSLSKVESLADLIAAMAGSGLTQNAGTKALDVSASAAPRVVVAAFGDWRKDGDGARTSGGGIVGDVQLTNASAAYCVVYDAGTTSYATLANSSSLTGWSANWQLAADMGASYAGDCTYFGQASIPFCEVAIDIATVATYTNDAFVWEYWSGAAWSALTVFDRTDTTAQDGKRSFQQDGAIVFTPPADWATTSVNSTTAYWIRGRIPNAGAIFDTAVPKTNSVEHDIVTSDHAISVPLDGQITAIRASDAAGTLHTANDVVFFVINWNTGLHSGQLTWAQDKRSEYWSGLTLDVSADDEIGVVVITEDGTNEIANAVLELTVGS